MSSTFEYNETGTGNGPFADDNNNNNTSLGLFGCGDPGGGGRQELRWGMMGLSILIVATASGNLLVCLAVSWERRLQNMTNYFLMSLAIADLLVSLLVMPLAMIVEMFGCFPLDRSLCVIWATMDVLLCTASIWHMCTMSMDRYFTIRYPIRYGRNKTKKMMTLKITFVWIISFSVSAPLAIAGFVDYSNVYNDGRCVPSIKNFVLYGSLFAFYVPLIIMVTTYTLTIRILKQNRVLMSGLQGKYHFPLPIAGERLRRGHRSNGLSRTGESTRRSCPDLSPPRSDFTMTSVGMTTSPKGGSSAESTMTSPSGGGGGGERRGAFNARNKQRSMRAQLLKANLADDDNYVNCNFDQKMFLKPTEPSKDVRRPSLVVRLKEALTPSSSSSSSSPKRKQHSKSSTTTSRADRRRSHPNPPRYRIDPDDQWNPSLMPFFRISRYYSDSNLAILQAEYDSQSVLDTSCFTPPNKQRLNGGTTGTTGRERFVRQDQTKNGGDVLVPNSYIRDNGHQQTTGLRLASPGSTAVEGRGGGGGGGGGGTAFDDSSYPDFEMTLTCYEDGETLQMEAPSSCMTAQTSCMTTQTSCMTTQAARMTTQTTTTDASGEKSLFPVDGVPSAPPVAGRCLDNSPPFGRSWTSSTADGRGLEEKQRNGGGPPPETTDVQQEPDNNSHASKQQQQQSNGSAKKSTQSNSTTCKEDEAEELDEVRGLLASTPTRRKGPPPRPSSMTGSPWSRTSPSTINTSPSSSDSRSILRARFNLGRSIRKATPVSACARKIGLLSKNRTNNERKASKVLGIIFAVFVLSWTPFFTMNIVSVLCDSCMETITDSMMASMVWLGYLSSLANPIIYTMFSTSFRTVFYRILTCQYSNQTVRCGQARSGGGHSGLQSNDESFLCWSRSGGRNSSCCLKDFETKKIGGV